MMQTMSDFSSLTIQAPQVLGKNHLELKSGNVCSSTCVKKKLCWSLTVLSAAGGFDLRWRYAGIGLQLPCRPHHNPSQPLPPPLQGLTPGSWPWPFCTGSSWPTGATGAWGGGSRHIISCDVMLRHVTSCHVIVICHVT